MNPSLAKKYRCQVPTIKEDKKMQTAKVNLRTHPTEADTLRSIIVVYHSPFVARTSSLFQPQTMRGRPERSAFTVVSV